MTFEQLYPIMRATAYKFVGRLNSLSYGYRCDVDELVNEIWIRLQTRVISEKYIARQCKQCAIDYLRGISRHIDAQLDELYDAPDKKYNSPLEFGELYGFLCNGLSNKLQEVSDMLYLDGLDQIDIVRKLGFQSRGGVSERRKRVINHFRRRYELLELV